MFWFFVLKACGILGPWPGVGPTPLALKGKVLTTGPWGKSLQNHFNSPTSSQGNMWYLPSLVSTHQYELLKNLFFLRFFFFYVDHLQSVHWICYDIASLLHFLLFRGRPSLILAPWQGMDSTPPALEAQSLTPWPARKVPEKSFYFTQMFTEEHWVTYTPIKKKC